MILTKRLHLRKLLVSDITQDYADWLNDPKVNLFLSCRGTVQTLETCVDYVKSWTEHKGYLIGIFHNEQHIGNITIQKDQLFNKKSRTVVIGISIGRRELWGKGLAREALIACTDYCFGELDATRVSAGVNVNNLRSINAFLSAGFLMEGRMAKADSIDGVSSDVYIFAKTI